MADLTPGETRHCERPGCLRATSGRKPFCGDHVEDMPYVTDLLARIAGTSKRESEEAA